MFDNQLIFKNFVEAHPDWEKTYHVYHRDHSTYKRIKCRCREAETKIAHDYHASINTKTGEIYFDCCPRKIIAKHFVLIFARPIHTIIKTLWHLSIVGPLALEIHQVKKGDQNFKELGINTLRSLADIGRTPIYGTAMTVMHIAGFILGCIVPNTVYDTREIVGRLERKMLWTNSIYKNQWGLSPCFSPLKHILPRDKNNKIIDNQGAINLRLAYLAMSRVRTMRKYRELFTIKLPLDAPYVSEKYDSFSVVHLFRQALNVV